MKKTLKKLVLSRETVRTLADQELSNPRGASYTYPTLPSIMACASNGLGDVCVPDMN